MDDERELGVYGAVLGCLLFVRDWKPGELAAEAKVNPKLLSNYLRGQKRLKRYRLDFFASVMGFVPGEVDDAIRWVEVRRAGLAARRGLEGALSRDRQEMEDFIQELGREAERFGRRLLDLAERQGMAALLRQRAQKAWAWLRRYKPEERRLLAEQKKDLWRWPLVEVICGSSIEAAADNATDAVHLAELALTIAERVPGDEALRREVQGWAWAHVGNAYRVHGNLRRAEDAFNQFRRFWKSGTEPRSGFLDEALVLGLEASLLRAQRHFDQGLEIIDQALAMARGRLVPQLLNNKARLLTEAGDKERALLILSHAESLPEAKNDPRLQRILRSSMVDCLCHLERYEEAADLMRKVWTAAPEAKDELTLLHLRWLEGRVAGGLGRTEEALENLEVARQGFLTREIAYEAALVTLEMASFHLDAGRTAEVKKLVREMAPIFESQRVHREALAALRLFREAAQRERATSVLARRVVAYLYKAQHNPELRFEDRTAL